MGKISVVIAIWHYLIDTLERTIFTLSNQSCPPLEIIVIEGSMGYSSEYRDLESEYPLLHIIHAPIGYLNLSKLNNIGILYALGDYIMITGADRLFSKNYMKEMSRLASESRVIISGWGTLPETTDISGNVHSRWDKLCEQIIPGSSIKVNPGCAIVLHRDWLLENRGYDEKYPFLYSDSSIIARAERSGLKRKVVMFDKAQALHKAHAPSELMHISGVTLDKLYAETGAIRNLEGWGGEE